MLDKIREAMWITTNDFDAELTSLIERACADLGVVGVEATAETEDPLLLAAVATYCRLNFGSPDDYDRLKRSYDEQKAQLITCTGYGME